MAIELKNVSERTWWLMYKLDLTVHWLGYVDEENELVSGLDKMELFTTEEDLNIRVEELNFPS